ncbi:MAG: CBS domain-containing protein [Nitrospirales bacterium]|nr:CBS domain-containing protein [Nitrospirales bacterium]
MDLQQKLQQTYIRMHPRQAARYLEMMSPRAAGDFLSDADAQDAAAVMEFILPGPAAKFLNHISHEKGAKIIAALNPSSARSVLRQCDPQTQISVLAHVEPAIGNFLGRTLKFPEHTAGALADPRVLTLPPDITVAEAQSRISVERRQAIYYLYVIGHNSTLCGVVLMKELLASDPDRVIETLMTSKVMAIPAEAYAQDLLSHSGWQVFDSLPVVEQGKYFLGALRYRVLRKVTESQSEDHQDQFFSDALLQLWEAYSLSGIELMTSLAQVLRTTGDQKASDTKKETP